LPFGLAKPLPFLILFLAPISCAILACSHIPASALSRTDSLLEYCFSSSRVERSDEPRRKAGPTEKNVALFSYLRQYVSHIGIRGESVARISPSATQAFFLRLLRPVAKIMLRHGVSYRDLAELCKRVYVSAATDEFGLDGRPANVSRVAMLTGMTRRDVRKVRLGLDTDEEKILARLNNASRILSGWYQDPEFINADGEPLPLTPSGPSPSFSELSRRYAGDIPVTTTLKELKSVGAVSVDDDGNLIAVTRYYMPGSTPSPTTAETLLRSGSVLEDIGDTIDHNLRRTASEQSRFEGRATNRNVSRDSREDFKAFLEKEGQQFLEKVDQWLSDHEVAKQDQDSPETLRLGIGAYWIEGQTHSGAKK